MTLRKRLTILGSALTMLTACTSSSTGVPTAPEDVDMLTSRVALGDLTTMDPCSLTDPSVFDEFGISDHASPESFDYCRIDVRTASAIIQIRVGAVEKLVPDPDAPVERLADVGDGIWIGQRNYHITHCTQLLVFPDDVVVEVEAETSDGATETCPIVDAGMAETVEVVRGAAVRHRSPQQNSLLGIDACQLLETEDLSAVRGLTDMRPEHGAPSRHTCTWTLINDVKVRVRIELHAGPVPQPSAQGSTETPVADRPTVTTPLAVIAGTGICELSTQHISFAEIPEYPAIVEIATIHTELRDDEDCTDATTLATAAWRTLPTP